MTQQRPNLEDLETIHHRYAAERDKRIREDGNDQYVEIAGDLAHYVDDPYVEPGFQRDPITRAVDALIIGGGFGGLLAGARLRQAGVKDICVVEKGGDFGGTWYWNRYPGAQCDVVLHLSAAARRTRLHAEGEVFPCAGDSRAQPRHRQAL